MARSFLTISLLMLTCNALPHSKPAVQPHPLCANPPKTRGSSIDNGIMSLSIAGLLAKGGASPSGSTTATGPESPKTMGIEEPNHPGTGLFPAKRFTDPSLPNHVIYAPATPSKDPLPLIVFGEGGCFPLGTMFSNLHIELASHGFMVVANGANVDPRQGILGFGLGSLAAMLKNQTTSQWLTDSIDWAEKGAAGGKYGVVDMTRVATAGQSCGGLEAYSAAYHDDRVKAVVLFNSGLIDRSKECLLKEFNVPVALFIGGPIDVAYQNAEGDFKAFKADLPVLKANLEAGHMGTYSAKNGGKFAKIAVQYFKWIFKGDKEAGKLFTDPQSSLINQDKWKIESKNLKL